MTVENERTDEAEEEGEGRAARRDKAVHSSQMLLEI